MIIRPTLTASPAARAAAAHRARARAARVGSQFGDPTFLRSERDDRSHLLQLIFFFFFFLCFFHSILAFRTTITRRVARGTDYVYFSFALFGIVVASLAQGRDSGLYYAAVAGMVGPKSINEVESDVQHVMPWCNIINWPHERLIDRLIFAFAPNKLDENTCSFLQKVDTLLAQRNYSEIPDLLIKTRIPLRQRFLPSVKESASNNVYFTIKLELESLYYTSSPAGSKDIDTSGQQ
jgi:hypothetical protein